MVTQVPRGPASSAMAPVAPWEATGSCQLGTTGGSRNPPPFFSAGPSLVQEI